MDQSSLVEMQIDDGAKIVEKLRESGFDVVAAWWMKTTEEGQWFLYIASKEVDEKGSSVRRGDKKWSVLCQALLPALNHSFAAI